MAVGGEFYPLVVKTCGLVFCNFANIKVYLLKIVCCNMLLNFTHAEEPDTKTLNKTVHV